MTANAELLLDGPRGRRLCLELGMELDRDVRMNVFQLGDDLDPASGTSKVVLTAASGDAAAHARVQEQGPVWSQERLAAALIALDLTGFNEELIQTAFQRSVEAAMYWQEPDGEDILAEWPKIRAAWLPLAERVMALPDTQWYRQPRHAEQWTIDWRSADDPAPLPGTPGQTLKEWGRNERTEELRAGRERPADPHANWSGSWWSIPHGLIQTVGQIPAGLDLVEDSLGWEHATVLPVRGVGRTYEVHSVDDWVSLCRAYPLEVTASAGTTGSASPDVTAGG